jgi:hypothetical protein
LLDFAIQQKLNKLFSLVTLILYARSTVECGHFVFAIDEEKSLRNTALYMGDKAPRGTVPLRLFSKSNYMVGNFGRVYFTIAK